EQVRPEDLPRASPLDAALTRFRSFGERSPIRILLGRLSGEEREQVARNRSGIVVRTLDGRGVLFYRLYEFAARRTRENVLRHAGLAGLEKIFAEVARLARERGLDARVVLAPAKEEVYAWLLDGREPWTSSEAPSGF